MAVLAKTTLLFSRAEEEEHSVGYTFCSLDGAFYSSGSADRLQKTPTLLFHYFTVMKSICSFFCSQMIPIVLKMVL